MRLFVGLGNPGAKYAGNRHNIGFMALDRIAADHGFGPWRKAHHGLVAEGRLGLEKVVLLKPETFMNLSGQSVQSAVSFYKLALNEVTVFHDELDLAPGKCRVKSGIGHPGHKDAVAAYVLHDFAKADQDWLDDLMRGISDGAEVLAVGDSAKFLNAVALRTAPPRNSGTAGPPEATPAPKPAPAAAPAKPVNPFDALRGLLRKDG